MVLSSRGDALDDDDDVLPLVLATAPLPLPLSAAVAAAVAWPLPLPLLPLVDGSSAAPIFCAAAAACVSTVSVESACSEIWFCCC